MTMKLSSVFGGALGGITGVVVTAYKSTRFTTAPVETAAPPSGTPDAGPVTTALAFGGPGAWHMTAPLITTYWVSAVFATKRYWYFYPSTGGGGTIQTLESTSGEITVTTPTGPVTNLAIAKVPTGALVAGTGMTIATTGGKAKLNVTTNEVTLSGDVVGNSTNNSVHFLRGHALSATAPTTGKALVWLTTGGWQPAHITLAGDVTGSNTAVTVVKLHGHPLTGATPSAHYVMAWTGSATKWLPVKIGTLVVAGTRITKSTTGNKVKLVANVQTTTKVTMGGGVTGTSTAATVAKAPSGSLVAGTGVTLATTSGKALISTTTIPAVAHNTGVTLALTDAGKFVTVTNASAKTITIPKAATVAFPTGTCLYVSQTGAGQVTIAAGGTVTLHAYTGALHTAGQYAVGMLRKMGTNTWRWFGQIA